ncbi:DUF4249 domain-containing protein [Hymenobacter sp. DH14]|uniref:DUF4249 domain-containing protein n=1 Tax=Hymenobacter cyanobacteriorum TaxID=2926463 RepID=A0A9X1VG44_9BACT|nr:DUF4249 domain-containing protein [Hymenobacter cyanobacteriorum]MCI1188569.1 DUF4249 domain-containing protein [Hymenobacter cyanobacteriorum]
MSLSTFCYRLAWVCGLALLLLPACTERYIPDVISSPNSYLVVDGFINSQGISSIKLSRTTAIAATKVPPVETKATLFIEEEAGTRYPLTENPLGTYTSANLTLNPAKRYHLRINTFAGKAYTSDFAPVKTTPAIDAVTWETNPDGLNILVDSHDPTNATRYYRWECDEAWEFNTPYRPIVEYVNGAIRPIAVPYPDYCWAFGTSTAITIGKTTALTQDVVSKFPVRYLPSSSARLQRKYSVLVQQYALTSEEYAYWDLQRRNTESLGTLFDPLPSQVKGNLHNVGDASELVLGFVGVHSRAEKRIFINHAQLPRTWVTITGYESCEPPDTALVGQLDGLLAGGRLYVPIYPFYTKTGYIFGYAISTPVCVDCRKRGSALKPSFWP